MTSVNIRLLNDFQQIQNPNVLFTFFLIIFNGQYFLVLENN